MKRLIKNVICFPIMPFIWLGRMIEPEEYECRDVWACGGRAAIINDWRLR